MWIVTSPAQPHGQLTGGQGAEPVGAAASKNQDISTSRLHRIQATSIMYCKLTKKTSGRRMADSRQK